MARYEHLPIYKSAMDLAMEMEKTVRNMSRYDKYGIGTELRKRSLAILSFVVRANSTDKKREVLEKIRITIEEVKQLLFLGKETKALPSFTIFKKFFEIVGTDAEELAIQNHLKPYYKRRKKHYGFRRHRLRKILYSMKTNYMSGVLVRETDEITDKIKARIPVYSWKLRKPVQLELFSKEGRRKV